MQSPNFYTSPSSNPNLYIHPLFIPINIEKETYSFAERFKYHEYTGMILNSSIFPNLTHEDYFIESVLKNNPHFKILTFNESRYLINESRDYYFGNPLVNDIYSSYPHPSSTLRNTTRKEKKPTNTASRQTTQKKPESISKNRKKSKKKETRLIKHPLWNEYLKDE